MKKMKSLLYACALLFALGAVPAYAAEESGGGGGHASSSGSGDEKNSGAIKATVAGALACCGCPNSGPWGALAVSALVANLAKFVGAPHTPFTVPLHEKIAFLRPYLPSILGGILAGGCVTVKKRHQVVAAVAALAGAASPFVFEELLKRFDIPLKTPLCVSNA